MRAALKCVGHLAALLIGVTSSAWAQVTVTLTAPTNGATYTAPAAITVSANATPPSGYTISKVEFFQGTTLIGTDTNSPYSINWSNVGQGNYSLMAKATAIKKNSPNQTGTSSAVSITVNPPPPWVTLTTPTSGLTYEPPASITLTATATPPSGYTVSKVEFFHGTTLIGTDTGAPYSIVWSNVPQGNYVLTAKATAIKKNNPDQTSTSSLVNVAVTQLPLVNLTSPTQGATVRLPVTVTATASDSDGTIASVRFYYFNGWGCSGEATVTNPPYTAVLHINPEICEGEFIDYNFTLGVRATDNQGATGWAPEVGVTLVPSVTLTSPSTGTNYNPPATIPLEASVSPSPFWNVRFYQGTTLIGEVNGPGPYVFNWQNVSSGTYSLTAQGTNSQGTFTSDPVVVTVSTPGPSLYFVHVDHLNTPRLVANQQGQTVWRWDQQEPFGVSVPDENPSSLGAFEFPLRFPGQYADKETNLHYNYFRDYDPSLGRYGESDPIGLDGGLNTYAYVGANPLALTDPLGLDWGICCPDGRKQKTGDDEDRVGASQDFARNYHVMRRWKQSDKYFHCKANCEAAQRGPAGYGQSISLSNAREFTDQLRGDDPFESDADQAANIFGRESGKQMPCADCRMICKPYRPRGLPSRY